MDINDSCNSNSPVKHATIVHQQKPLQLQNGLKNIIFKGWILALQEANNNVSNTPLKWVPKYAVVNKLEKTLFLYDYEVINHLAISKQTYQKLDEELIPENVSILKMDNSIKREAFIQYWRNKSENFDAEFKKYSQESFTKSSSISNRLSNIFHMSRDTAESSSFDKDLEWNQTIVDSSDQEKEIRNSNLTTSISTPFRFAGLFSKKDKTEKNANRNKHSSLKRAKSGIQLERKKPVLLVHNSANMSIIETKKNNGFNTDYENRLNVPSTMRPSRSHESLASPLKPNSSHELQSNQFNKSSSIKSRLKLLGQQTPSSKSARLTTSTTTTVQSTKQKDFQQLTAHINRDTIQKFSLLSSDQQPVTFRSIHQSLFNEENCFELKSISSFLSMESFDSRSFDTDLSDDYDDDYADYEYADDEYQQKQQYRHARQRNSVKNRLVSKAGLSNGSQSKYSASVESYSVKYFLCRTGDEREKWLQCLKSVTEPKALFERRHSENSMMVWLLEAKGQAISVKPTKKYFCEIFLNNVLCARTCSKERKEILFWGENFDFNDVHCSFLRVELYQETNAKKKSKQKERDNLNNTACHKEPTSIHAQMPNKTLLGYISIPVNSIEGSQPVEKWYRLEPASSISNSTNQLNEETTLPTDSLSAFTISTNQPIATSSASLTTTQNFNKDAISIRIKAKYQSVDILPLECYRPLIDYIRTGYLNLMITLEPQLNVRVKDDLANSLVQIAHKLNIQRKFLSDLVLAEIMQLEDSSLTFRGNSLATKAMEFYMKLVGDSYLKQTLSDCVRAIIDTRNDLEIDPSKVSNQSSLQANRDELMQILHLVCGRVFNSCINFPVEIKQVFAELRHKCKLNGKTDEMCDILISASIFLRFICPAILSPNLFNLTQEYPQEKAARKLTLVAKTLQTIANFSKFGGKESYMSFGKMNQFVDEHTIMMREFLRNISSLTAEDLKVEEEAKQMSADLNMAVSSSNQVLPILTLTPQSPNKSYKTIPQTCQIFHQSDNNVGVMEERNFKPELIDLGKQLSILHSLLVTILSGLDDKTRIKFTDELLNVLNYLTELKKNNDFNNFTTPLTVSATPKEVSNAHQNKIYSYENRLHVAIKNTNQLNNHSSSISLPGTAPGLRDINDYQVSNRASLYSSQIIANLNDDGDLSQQNNLESNINILKNKLRDTEISLKKEQTEKYLIEYKLKQQQQDNDLQMRSIINRLIKVEEELRKEQVEMHKLLKAKQDLIDIQKKRIEHLSNRTNIATQNQHPSSTKSLATNVNDIKFQQINNNILNISPTNQSKDAWVPSDVEQPIPQIVASPSSSSSSMTQFCKYLAQNTLIKPAKTGLNDIQANFLHTQTKRKSSYQQNQLEDLLSKSSPRILSPNSQEINGIQADATPSSTSSSSSALSTSSSLNHLNHANHQSIIINSNSDNNDNINASIMNGSSFNFFRTSEL